MGLVSDRRTTTETRTTNTDVRPPPTFDLVFNGAGAEHGHGRAAYALRTIPVHAEWGRAPLPPLHKKRLSQSFRPFRRSLSSVVQRLAPSSSYLCCSHVPSHRTCPQQEGVLESVWSSYSRSQPVVQFAVLWPLGVDTLRPFDHEADPEDRRCRTRRKLYRPYAFYTAVTTIRSDAYGPKPASPSAHQK